MDKAEERAQALVENHDRPSVAQIAQAIRDAEAAAEAKTIRTLGSAIRKFAPDLSEQLIVRHTDAVGALDDFLDVLRSRAEKG